MNATAAAQQTPEANVTLKTMSKKYRFDSPVSFAQTQSNPYSKPYTDDYPQASITGGAAAQISAPLTTAGPYIKPYTDDYPQA